MTLKLLDLFAGAGGAGEGYRRAGFTTIGIDITPHPDYPGEHQRRDGAALKEMRHISADATVDQHLLQSAAAGSPRLTSSWLYRPASARDSISVEMSVPTIS